MIAHENVRPALPMPIKATPYRHQIEAFNFVCGLSVSYTHLKPQEFCADSVFLCLEYRPFPRFFCNDHIYEPYSDPVVSVGTGSFHCKLGQFLLR